MTKYLPGGAILSISSMFCSAISGLALGYSAAPFLNSFVPVEMNRHREGIALTVASASDDDRQTSGMIGQGDAVLIDYVMIDGAAAIEGRGDLIESHLGIARNNGAMTMGTKATRQKGRVISPPRPSSRRTHRS